MTRAPRAGAGLARALQAELKDDAASAAAKAFAKQAAADAQPDDLPELSSADLARVLADFEARRVLLLRADWTRRDPAITAALTQLGRSGVPVYVIYRAGQPPVVLPEILSVEEVRAELAKL